MPFLFKVENLFLSCHLQIGNNILLEIATKYFRVNIDYGVIFAEHGEKAQQKLN